MPYDKLTISLIKLYLIFVKVGAILLGGGYVILPILTSELCKKRSLIDEADLVDYFALSQSLPGIIAANISMFTGYKLRGVTGAISAMLGVITVPFFTIIFLATMLSKLTDNIYIDGIFWGVGIAVIVLILLTAREIWQMADRGLFFYTICIGALIALLYFKLSPIIVILGFSFIGVIIKTLQAKRSLK